ncbi:MAG: hypothetical protein U0325_14535 [Polyangiales bacterium]
MGLDVRHHPGLQRRRCSALGKSALTRTTSRRSSSRRSAASSAFASPDVITRKPARVGAATPARRIAARTCATKGTSSSPRGFHPARA